MDDPSVVADRAMERLWQLAWADDEERLAITELLLHFDIPELVTTVRSLCRALEEVGVDRPAG